MAGSADRSINSLNQAPERRIMAGDVIRCSSVRKVFANRAVLSDVNLSIHTGEKLAILGSSGSGKTTLLRIMAGLETATSGQITMNGQPVKEIPAAERSVGMVFQLSSVYPHMSVEENLAFPLRCRRFSHPQISDRVKELAGLLGITRLLKQSAASLSGGESQRVAIGKALATPPSLLLLDEPFSNLDADLRWRLLDEIKRLHDRLHLTTVLVTHNIGEALYVADRVGVLSGGQILQLAAPDLLFARPASLEVARLLYSPILNSITGELISKTDRMAEFRPLDGLPSLQLSQDGKASNNQVVVSWRPNDASLALDAASIPLAVADHWVVPAEVTNLDFWEGRRLATLTASKTVLRVPAPNSIDISSGTKVHVIVPRASIVVFSAADGRRMPLLDPGVL